VSPDAFRSALEWAAVALESASAVTILGGAATAVYHVARRLDVSRARHSLSHALLLALDFAIGADVIKVAATPELATVLVVGGIVAIRIALTLTIGWELRRGSLAPSAGRDATDV
jgi:uncharacterized membrane protein